MAKTPRGWTGARTPSAIKRVRQAERRRAINQPRKSAAKTYATNAVNVATGAREGDAAASLAEAMSALDRAAKVGAIHPNNAARRKSRLALKLNDLAGGMAVQTTARVTKTTGTAAAVKAARTRIASAKASKAKGPQTAAGKVKAALSKTARAETAPTPDAPKTVTRAAKPVPKSAPARISAETPAKAAAKTPARATERTAPKTTARAEKPVPKARVKAADKAAPKAVAKAAPKASAKAEKPEPKAEKKPKA
ncbi:MAG: 30S ribosomal protein S20 [Candidatus Limnocylindrales bacterium]